MIVLDRDALAQAYAARRCAICGQAVSVTCPGTAEEWVEACTTLSDGSSRKYSKCVTRGVPDIDLCLTHAAERWPWKSHKSSRRKRA